MSLILDSIFSSIALGHLIVDVLNGQRSVLLTYWSAELGLSNTTLALVTMIYIWVASLSQPVFGWITDRFGKSRLMAAGGILWMCSLFALALYLPVHFAIPCLILASLGSAAFHPAGVMQATLRGQTRLERHETIALPIGLNAAWQLRKTPAAAATTPKTVALGAPRPVVAKSFIITLALVAALQAWAQQNMITFVPKYLSDMGKTAAVYGLIAGLFMGGSAIGNVIGGNLADRFSKQRVAMTTLALASIPLFLLSIVGWSPWLYLLVPLSGMFTGAVLSIIVVLAQRTIRGGMALASGLTLGFMFSVGALGTLLSGPLADRWGFPPLFQMTAGLAILASLLTLFLREPI